MTQVAVLIIDIDDFKRINDSYGHLAGDAVLKELAAVLEQTARKVDVVGRYGGDEFVVVMPKTGPAGADRLRRRVREAVAARTAGENRVSFTVSVGMHAGTPDSVEEALGKSDSDLYATKDRKDELAVDRIEQELDAVLDEDRPEQ